MRPHLLLAGIVLALAVPAIPTTAAAAAPVEVTFDRTSRAAALGDPIMVRARIANVGTATSDPLIADLNVTSVTTAVYVDLEDWSASRTHELPPLRPGASTVLSFELQAVKRRPVQCVCRGAARRQVVGGDRSARGEPTDPPYGGRSQDALRRWRVGGRDRRTGVARGGSGSHPDPAPGELNDGVIGGAEPSASTRPRTGNALLQVSMTPPSRLRITTWTIGDGRVEVGPVADGTRRWGVGVTGRAGGCGGPRTWWCLPVDGPAERSLG